MSRTTTAKRIPWGRLRRFFLERQPITVAQAEALICLDPAAVVEALDTLGVRTVDGCIPWSDAAELICQTLTPVEIHKLLRGTPGFPPLLLVQRVAWRIPAWLLLALENRVAEERTRDPAARRLTVEAFVARELQFILEPDPIQQLNVDAAFRAAAHFPEGEE